MNTIWQDFLKTRGARFDQGVVADFGHPTDELAATRAGTVLVPLDHLALFECTGEDATSFLHNQLTSDVNHLDAGTAQHSSWCTHKGRMQASFILYRQGADYRALLSADLLDSTLKQLQRYVLRAKAQLRDLSNEQIAIGVSGPQAGESLRAAGLTVPEAPMTTLDAGTGTTIRLDAQRFIVIADAAAAPALYDRLAGVAHPAGVPVWHWLDIEAGIVLVTADTKEEFVPQMVNFDKIGGVSFHKGCYPGQEVVARAQYLGKIKRHLYQIRTNGPMVAGGSLFLAGKSEQPCGLIANTAPAPDGLFAALAVIKEEATADEMHLKIPGVDVTSVKAVAA